MNVLEVLLRRNSMYDGMIESETRYAACKSVKDP